MTCTGNLYRLSLELLLLELGMGSNLHLISFDCSVVLAAESLLKSSWKLLNANGLQLKHAIFRLYLYSFYLSDILNGSGSFITDDEWLGRPLYNKLLLELWPKHAPPTRNDWFVWSRYLTKCSFSMVEDCHSHWGNGHQWAIHGIGFF